MVRDLPDDGRVDGYDKVSAALPLSVGQRAATEDRRRHVLIDCPLSSPQNKGATRPPLGRESEQSQGHVLELDDGWKVSFNTDTTSGPLRKNGRQATHGFSARTGRACIICG